MKAAQPVPTAHLFPSLHQHLVTLLEELEPAAWSLRTVAGQWQVRDVVAHLIDVQLRRLSFQRDGHELDAPAEDMSQYANLVAFLNSLNASWVSAMRRLSPAILLDLLDVIGPQFAAFVAELKPEGRAAYPVAWAGEKESTNWFDVGRDYTELWHHQAQIRWAVRAEPLEERRWLHPVLALAVRGLPRALAGLERPDGTAVVLTLEGDAGGVWTATVSDGAWSVSEGSEASPAAEIWMPAHQAWKVFFNALSESEVHALAQTSGDNALWAAVLRFRSIMV